jgi:hypothetical protein
VRRLGEVAREELTAVYQNFTSIKALFLRSPSHA